MSRCVKQFVEEGDVVTVISTHSPRVRSLGIDGDDVRLGLVAGLASLQHKAAELARDHEACAALPVQRAPDRPDPNRPPVAALGGTGARSRTDTRRGRDTVNDVAQPAQEPSR